MNYVTFQRRTHSDALYNHLKHCYGSGTTTRPVAIGAPHVPFVLHFPDHYNVARLSEFLSAEAQAYAHRLFGEVINGAMVIRMEADPLAAWLAQSVKAELCGAAR